MADKKQSAEADTAAGEVKVDGPVFPTRGAQVRVTGQALDAARGAYGTIEDNTVVKKALEADGTVADGSTVDGSTLTGKPAPDVVVTTEAKPGGETPAEAGTTRIVTDAPPAAAKPAAKRA